ncbi:hypothetical protein F4802DRAFT_120439 [Xylaria palmicola]|nr:hypothetical protein F4802DRAFT_120439 [Xylaria palmicola]
MSTTFGLFVFPVPVLESAHFCCRSGIRVTSPSLATTGRVALLASKKKKVPILAASHALEIDDDHPSRRRRRRRSHVGPKKSDACSPRHGTMPRSE